MVREGGQDSWQTSEGRRGGAAGQAEQAGEGGRDGAAVEEGEVEVLNAGGDRTPGWEFLGEDEDTMQQRWIYDTAAGYAGRAEENALLSDDAKKYMYILYHHGCVLPAPPVAARETHHVLPHRAV